MSKVSKFAAIPAAAREILEQVSRALEIKQMAKRPAPLQSNYAPSYQPLDLSREGYNTTQSIFPQYSIMDNNPRLVPGDSYGKGGRMQQLVDNMPAVSNVLAERIAPAVGSESGYFYHVGPIYEALRKAGLSDQEALNYVDEFADLFGATSPRTNTLDNLRNASILQFKAGQGIPFDRKALDGTPGNDRGFGMTDAHKERGLAYMNKDYNQAANPKPVNFTENSRGNLENVTVDTHVIRGAVDALEEVVGEGALNPNWLTKSARDTYKKEGRFSTATDVDDGLDAKKTVPYGGVTTQVEYSPMAEMFSDVANKVGVTPGEGQALAWFGTGDKTGLVSSDRTIARLWQDRVAATAEMLGVSFDQAAKMVGKKQIPIYGTGALAVSLSGESEAGFLKRGIDAGNDVVTGDIVEFKQDVFGGSYKRPTYLGQRTVHGEVLRESYGADKQQHTFTIKPLNVEGVNADELLKKDSFRIKGRNLYKHGVLREMSDDEAARKLVADEKHERGAAAREARDIRKGMAGVGGAAIVTGSDDADAGALSAATRAAMRPQSSVSKFWDTLQETMGGTRGLADNLLMPLAVVPNPLQIPAAAIELGLLATDAVDYMMDPNSYPDQPSTRGRMNQARRY